MTRPGPTSVFVSALAVATAAGQERRPGPEPAVPAHAEVKVGLDPEACAGADGGPSRAVREAFRVEGPATRLQVQFLDAPGLGLNRAGWNVWLSVAEGERPRITFRRRYPVLGDPAQALRQAADDGFHAGEADYEAADEWGLAARAVSFTRTRVLFPPGPVRFDLPDPAASRRHALGEMPGKLNLLTRPGWAAQVLSEAHVFGPVRGRRWAGKLPGGEARADLEVWDVPGRDRPGPDFVVEVSHRAEADKAEAGRDRLVAFLREKRWLSPSDRPLQIRLFERFR